MPGWWGGSRVAQQRYWVLWPPWVVSPKQWVLGRPSGAHRLHPCCAHIAKCHQWGTPGKWQCVATRGQGGTAAALLALVATMAGLPQAAGAWGAQWALVSVTMWCHLCWLPPVGHTRPKWQCVATGGQGAQQHYQPLWPPQVIGPKHQVLRGPI